MMSITTVLLLVSLVASEGHAAGGLRKVGSETAALGENIRVRGVGSGPFDPTKLKNWVPDARSPLIAPNKGGSCPGNIYNPTIVANGPGGWNVYFGGWDGVSTCKDSVSVTVTEDHFSSFHPHSPMIRTGTCQHVNNPNAQKVNGKWVMVYTQDDNNINKPGISTGSSGIDWTPNAGGGDFLQMAAYPFDWGNATSGADVNGGNVLLHDATTDSYHLYFTDVKQLNSHSVFHATAPGSNLNMFTYQGRIN